MLFLLAIFHQFTNTFQQVLESPQLTNQRKSKLKWKIDFPRINEQEQEKRSEVKFKIFILLKDIGAYIYNIHKYPHFKGYIYACIFIY